MKSFKNSAQHIVKAVSELTCFNVLWNINGLRDFFVLGFLFLLTMSPLLT